MSRQHIARGRIQPQSPENVYSQQAEDVCPRQSLAVAHQEAAVLLGHQEELLGPQSGDPAVEVRARHPGVDLT